MELADTSQGEGGGAQGMSWVLERRCEEASGVKQAR